MSALGAAVRKHPIGTFCLITFAWSWTWWYAAGVYEPGVPTTGLLGWRWLGAQIGVFGPAVAGLVVLAAVNTAAAARARITIGLVFAPALALGIITARFTRENMFHDPVLGVGLVAFATLQIIVFSNGGRRLRTAYTTQAGPPARAPWIAVSLLLLPALLVVAMLVTGSSSGLELVLARHEIGRSLPWFLVVLFANELLYGGPLGEEPGWRGFLLPELQRRLSPLQASFVLGILWALWHGPIDVVHGFGVQGLGAVFIRLFWTMPLAIVFTWVFNRAGGSVLTALLLHTSVNYTAYLLEPSETAFAAFSLLGWGLSAYVIVQARMWQPMQQEARTEPPPG